VYSVRASTHACAFGTPQVNQPTTGSAITRETWAGFCFSCSKAHITSSQTAPGCVQQTLQAQTSPAGTQLANVCSTSHTRVVQLHACKTCCELSASTRVTNRVHDTAGALDTQLLPPATPCCVINLQCDCQPCKSQLKLVVVYTALPSTSHRLT
jgi:hypothetical protein